MQEELIPQETAVNEAADTQSERPKLKRNGLKEEFKKKGNELDEKQKPSMTLEETIKFYEEKLPFMRMQNEYEEIVYQSNERRIKNLELNVRELEAVGFLAQWRAQQDDAKARHDQEQKMKEEWDAMTPEQQEEYKQKAKANLRIMELQAKGSITYNGTNAHEVMSFVTGDVHEPIILEDPNNRFCFQIPNGQGGFTELCMILDQTLTRTEAGEFIVS